MILLAMLRALHALQASSVMQHSVLEPKGPQAARTHALWQFALWVSVVVYVATIAALLWAAWRGHKRTRAGAAPPIDAEQPMRRGVALGVGVTVVLLLTFLALDLRAGRAMGILPTTRALTIEVTAHQWWWEATYKDPSPHAEFTTANELHIPVGRPVLIVLDADDVIHSFWVPSLAGKKDMIPGHRQMIWLQADTPRVYRGQCAEFCGFQHAKMAFFVIADPPDQYATWASHAQQSATPPSDPVTLAGQRAFMRSSCVMCHAIAGTSANSHAGPDLTHVASRETIAAGTLPNTRGNLAGWIVDPQRIKPGTRMPANQLAPADLDALLTYLQSLK